MSSPPSSDRLPPMGKAIMAAPQQLPAHPQGGSVQGTPLVLVLSTLQIKRGSPFYDMLATFVAATAGLTPVFDAEHYPDFLQGVGGVYRGMVWPTMTADLGDAVVGFRAGLLSQRTAEDHLCGMLANAAWETAGFNPEHSKWADPQVQFLRHVRNAASHGNRWSFKDPSPGKLGSSGTPNLPAAWRGFVIDHTRRGSDNHLHGKTCFGVSLSSGDLLRLLLDVEPLVS